MNSVLLPERAIRASRNMDAIHSRSVFRERASILVVIDLIMVVLPAQDKAAVRAHMVPIILYLLLFVEICLKTSLPFSGSGIFYHK